MKTLRTFPLIINALCALACMPSYSAVITQEEIQLSQMYVAELGLEEKFYNKINDLLELLAQKNLAQIKALIEEFPEQARPAFVNHTVTAREVGALIATNNYPGLASIYDAYRDTTTTGGHITPLSLAIFMGDHTIVQTLCDHYASLQYVFESNGDTPVHTAVRCNPSLIPLLISYGAPVNGIDENNAPLITAIIMESMQAIEYLLNAGASLNVRCSTLNNATPLHIACSKSNLDIARRLVNAGAFIDARNSAYWTPLHSATYNNNLALTTFLLDQGADILVRNINKQTIIESLPAEAPFSQIIWLLLRNGAPYPQTSAHQALIQTTIADELNHETPLLQMYYQWLLLEETGHIHGLLENITDQDIVNQKASTTFDRSSLLHLAVIRRNHSITQLLIHKPTININARDIHGRTPLMWAARLGDFALYYMLISAGARLMITDNEGHTALEYAIRGRNLSIIIHMLIHCIVSGYQPPSSATPSSTAGTD